MDDEKFMYNKDGELLRFADGRPVLLDMFVNEPMEPYWSYFSAQEIIELCLNEGVEVPEEVLIEKGLKKDSGK